MAAKTAVAPSQASDPGLRLLPGQPRPDQDERAFLGYDWGNSPLRPLGLARMGPSGVDWACDGREKPWSLEPRPHSDHYYYHQGSPIFAPV